ncbi:ABC transporter permease [Allofustis seminis]|uniref:ABC transporter permease n=1 Tax=Allofustis seminis TaxID=166939 RepID=UPI000381656A|nr:ABC transporter permease [Allofustis seminis]
MNQIKSKSFLETAAVPFFSILFGFILGAIVMLAFGYNPLAAYEALFVGVFTNRYFFGEALVQATVLTFTGLAFAVASRAGFFNIGVAGQFLFGWLASVTFALAFPSIPRILMVPLVLGVGMIAGSFYAGIAGFLRAYFGTSEVIVTIMLNHTMLLISNYMTNFVIGSGSKTGFVGDNTSLSVKFLSDLTNGSRLNIGFILAIIFVILYKIFMDHTVRGFELQAVGLNAEAARYAGMSAKRNIIVSMLISGGVAGIGGAIQGIGTFKYLFTQSSIPSQGFDGIAVALLGMGNPYGIFASSFLFGILKQGATFMPSQAGVPNELVDVVIASIIFFVGASYIIRILMKKFGFSKD